jgi:putative ABC transport system ATP-binding protein
MNDTLIKLEGLTKVFLTDEVETRVLWDINLEIKRGDYVSIAGPPAQRHFRGSGVWTPR